MAIDRTNDVSMLGSDHRARPGRLSGSRPYVRRLAAIGAYPKRPHTDAIREPEGTSPVPDNQVWTAAPLERTAALPYSVAKR